MDHRRARRSRATRGGVNRVVAVLLALVAVMLVVVAIPVWNAYSREAQRLACEQAMASARDGLIIEYLYRWEESSVEEAMVTLDQVMPARPDLCPSGGTIYLVKNDKGIYEPYCGLHDRDQKQRVRLNASRAMELLAEARRWALRESDEEPESLTISLNGRDLECVRVQAEERLRRGTATTDGYDGTVAFYGLAGEGDFSTENAKAGEIAYFIYADENYCAVWRAAQQWTGTAYD